jgi:hypothetical protein
LASVDITVSVDPADSTAAFEPEKITALSNLFWCNFSRRSALHLASISPSKAVECYPIGLEQEKSSQ